MAIIVGAYVLGVTSLTLVVLFRRPADSDDADHQDEIGRLRCNLPRASDASPFRLDTEAPDGIDHVAVEIRGPIKNQVLGSVIVGEGFAQPLRSPCASRVLRGMEMNNSTATWAMTKNSTAHRK
jgi:hypothetical protein